MLMNKKLNGKTITIFSHKLCGFLIMQNFVLLNMEPNKKYPNKKVFFFKQTEDIKKVIDYYNKNRDTIINKMYLDVK